MLTPLEAAWLAAISRDDTEEAQRLEPLIENPPAPPKKLAPVGAAALWYAENGWPVFPIRPGDKTPAISSKAGGQGFKDATCDPDQIRAWWTDMPRANVGIPTGIAFDVIDFDGNPDGVAEFRDEQMAEPDLPRLLGVVATPRGMHLYLPPQGLGNDQSIYPGVDYRGEGGYVVAPPSTTDKGLYWWVLPPTIGG